MSKEPKIEHDYHAGKDKLTITIHRYSLKSKKIEMLFWKSLWRILKASRIVSSLMQRKN
jgi:hypothetical protein